VVALRGLLVVAFYWWSQYWLLGGRVRWQALLPGAVAVAILTTGLLELSRLVMAGQISWQLRAYGPVGCVFVLSVWLMILSMLTFVGILIGALIAERRGNPGRGDTHGSEGTPLTPLGLDSVAETRTDRPLQR